MAVAVDVQLALAVALVDARIHVLEAVQVVATVTAIGCSSCEDAKKL